MIEIFKLNNNCDFQEHRNHRNHKFVLLVPGLLATPNLGFSGQGIPAEARSSCYTKNRGNCDNSAQLRKIQ